MIDGIVDKLAGWGCGVIAFLVINVAILSLVYLVIVLIQSISRVVGA